MMERKQIVGDLDPGPLPADEPVVRFGFVKQEHKSCSPEGFTKPGTSGEHERCVVF